MSNIRNLRVVLSPLTLSVNATFSRISFANLLTKIGKEIHLFCRVNDAPVLDFRDV